ncbi:MAG TPA: KUP/HAK/KT family potassium transporter, partial [Gemmatimonadales bacterium]|nr:KUP/HAK/KT family potassium transporter [Gemmatimonadales bacterium]
SDRLTMQNGVLLMSGAALLALWYTRGAVDRLVVMYSINVFLTFSLTELSMCRFWLQRRKQQHDWRRQIAIHVAGLVLCATILTLTAYEKFAEGGWVTLVLTAGLIALCFAIRRHYRNVQANLQRLDAILPAVPATEPGTAPSLEPRARTAVLLVGSYEGLGTHCLLSIQRLFPNVFQNFVFASVGVIDSATFKNVEEVEEIRAQTKAVLARYVATARALALAADSRMVVGTEVVAEGVELCKRIAQEFPYSVFFLGRLVFEEETWVHRILHNETAYQMQRRLQFAGLNAMVLPVRVLRSAA